ncbi:hypothetical protein, partial [Pseudomonas aeruginosa]|uniref:hypothetical protein n=1 Tax=Pseudomonas aeruginosa TaxID=287 RepID=UPI00293653D5
CQSGVWKSNGGTAAFSGNYLVPGSSVNCQAGPSGKILIQSTYYFEAPVGNDHNDVTGFIQDGTGNITYSLASTSLIGIVTAPHRESSDSMPVNFLHTGLGSGSWMTYRLTASAYCKSVSYWCLGI